MNCEKYQDLISDLVDGLLAPRDRDRVEAHLRECADCAEVRNDLAAIMGFCVEQRGQYEAVPNERALWLRISNMIEAESALGSPAQISNKAGWWFRLMNRSWQLSFPQLAASVAAIILVVSLATLVSVRRFMSAGGSGPQAAGLGFSTNALSVEDRYRQQQQVIAYWNQRVELNKTRWSPQMRETFDRNMSVIDAALNESLRRLNENPHDGVSEDILNAAMNDKVELLKEFADL